VEPFGGFCSVLLNKPRSPVEIYNDINKDVVNLLLCLKEHTLELISELSMMPYSRWLYEQLIGVLDEPFEVPNVERAAKWFYLNHSSFAGMKTRSSPGNWGHGAHHNVVVGMRDGFNNLLLCAQRLFNVQIENRSYEYVLEHYDSPDTFFYVDPPYYETDNVFVGLTLEQHEELRNRLAKLQGCWLLTYNEHAKIEDMYREFKIEKVSVQKIASQARDSGGVREYYTHLIISNIHGGEK
jgi:DNA adenine methylase